MFKVKEEMDSEETMFNNVYANLKNEDREVVVLDSGDEEVAEVVEQRKEVPIRKPARAKQRRNYVKCSALCPKHIYDADVTRHRKTCEIFRKANKISNIFMSHTNLLDWVMHNSSATLMKKYFKTLPKYYKQLSKSTKQIDLKCVEPCQAHFNNVDSYLQHTMICVIFNSPNDYKYTCLCGFISYNYISQICHERVCNHINETRKTHNIVDTASESKSIIDSNYELVTKCRPTQCNHCSRVCPRTIDCSGPCQRKLCYNCSLAGSIFNLIFDSKKTYFCNDCNNTYNILN